MSNQTEMVTHTSGPWKLWPPTVGVFDASSEVQYQFVSKSDFIGSEIALVVASSEEDKANARLIAAAPDLLEAAKLALRIAESWIHSELDGTSFLESDLGELWPIRAAIAKAEGS